MAYIILLLHTSLCIVKMPLYITEHVTLILLQNSSSNIFLYQLSGYTQFQSIHAFISLCTGTRASSAHHFLHIIVSYMHNLFIHTVYHSIMLLTIHVCIGVRASYYGATFIMLCMYHHYFGALMDMHQVCTCYHTFMCLQNTFWKDVVCYPRAKFNAVIELLMPNHPKM